MNEDLKELRHAIWISGGEAVSARALGVISRICEKAGGLEESRAARSGQRHIIRSLVTISCDDFSLYHSCE